MWQLAVTRGSAGNDVRSAAVTNPAIFVMFAQYLSYCIFELVSGASYKITDALFVVDF